MMAIKASPGILVFSLLCGCFCRQTPAQTSAEPYVLPMPPVIALQTRDLLQGATLGYRPWSDPEGEQGDIIEYTVMGDGSLHTDARTGAGRPVAGSDGGCDRPASGCWSARASLHARGADDVRSRYWQRRSIFTGNNGQIDFSWEQLAPAQRFVLDEATASSGMTHHGPWDSDILNYLRGERLHERQHAGMPGAGAALPDRGSILAAITASPVYIGPPQEQLAHVAGFSRFAATHRDRAGRVAAGTASGQLHVFDAADGSEVYAYIPSMLLDRLGQVAGPDGASGVRTEIGGGITVASAEVGRGQWRSILAGGGGNGFRGLYGLDVTEPGFTRNKLLFENDGGAWGHVFGPPRIGRLVMPGGRSGWYVFSGNGYLPTPGHPSVLMLIDLETGMETAIELPGATGGLSAVVLLSTDGDDGAEFAFAGDMSGNLWMFRLAVGDPDRSRAKRVFSSSGQRALLHAPVVARHPTAPGYLLYFVTSPLPGTAGPDSLHALWIDPDAPEADTDLPFTDRHLSRRTLTNEVGGSRGPLRTVSNNEPLRYRCSQDTRHCPQHHRGWYLHLPGCGERVNGSLQVRAGRVQFTTSSSDRDCGVYMDSQKNWLLSLDYLHGSDGDSAVFDINSDGILDRHDAIATGDDRYPVGIQLGAGRIAAPVHVRLDSGGDGVIINRLYPLAAINMPDSTGNMSGLLPPQKAAGTVLRSQAGPSGGLQPDIQQMPGPRARAGRYSWIDIVPLPASIPDM